MILSKQGARMLPGRIVREPRATIKSENVIVLHHPRNNLGR
jgi:hypothetical protein